MAVTVALILLSLGSCSALILKSGKSSPDGTPVPEAPWPPQDHFIQPCVKPMKKVAHYLEQTSGCVGGDMARTDTWTPIQCRKCVDKVFEGEEEYFPGLCWEDYYEWCDPPAKDDKTFVWYDWTLQAVYCYEFYPEEQTTLGNFFQSKLSGIEYAEKCAGKDEGLMAFLSKEKEYGYISKDSKFVQAGGKCSDYGYTERVIGDFDMPMSVKVFQDPNAKGVKLDLIMKWKADECTESPNLEVCHPDWKWSTCFGKSSKKSDTVDHHFIFFDHFPFTYTYPAYKSKAIFCYDVRTDLLKYNELHMTGHDYVKNCLMDDGLMPWLYDNPDLGGRTYVPNDPHKWYMIESDDTKTCADFGYTKQVVPQDNLYALNVSVWGMDGDSRIDDIQQGKGGKDSFLMFDWVIHECREDAASHNHTNKFHECFPYWESEDICQWACMELFKMSKKGLTSTDYWGHDCAIILNMDKQK